MTHILILAAVLVACWLPVSVVVGLIVGGAARLRDQGGPR